MSNVRPNTITPHLGLFTTLSTKINTKETIMNTNELFENVQGLTVLNLQREPVVLDSLWKDRRVALAFLRHFG